MGIMSLHRGVDTTFMKKFLLSFIYAGHGIWYCVRHERNFRIHLVATFYALALAALLSLQKGEWAALLTIIAVVITAEATNTAIERAVDLSTEKVHSTARIAKDAAAGAVLFCALISVIIGVILFYRPEELCALGAQFWEAPWKMLLLAISIAVSLLFIFRGGASSAKK